MAKKKNEDVHIIGIPRAWVPEIESFIKEVDDESYSINSFCRAAVRQMLDLLNTPSDERTEPKLCRIFDGARAQGAPLKPTVSLKPKLHGAADASRNAAAQVAFEVHGQSPPAHAPSGATSRPSKGAGKGQGGQQ